MNSAYLGIGGRSVVPVAFLFGLLIPAAWAQDVGEPLRPIRVMQEMPWAINTVTGVASSMEPVRGYWDQQTQTYFLDLLSLFTALGYEARVDGGIVRASTGQREIAVNYDTGVANPLDLNRSFQLLPGGYLRSSTDEFLMSLSNIRFVLPEGALEFDTSTLTVQLSSAVFGRDTSPFRLRTGVPAHMHGPLVYGRNRSLLGAVHASYRVSRAQHQSDIVNYNGSVQLQANVAGGHVVAHGTGSRNMSGDITTSIRSATYLLDIHANPFLSRIELGRSRAYRWPVRQAYEGARIGNEPLATRTLQHETELAGAAEPNAIVTAFVGGVAVDRVQADATGRYVLLVPAYYGTSQAEVEVAPPGGGTPTRETRYLFITEDLVPRGAVYWDISAGRDQYDHARFGIGELRIGVTESFTASGGIVVDDTLFTGMAGLTRNFSGFATSGLRISFPELAAQTFLRLYYRRLRINSEAEFFDQPGLSYYRRRVQGQLGASFQNMSLYINGSTYETFGSATTTVLGGSGVFRLARGLNLALSASQSTTKSAFGVNLTPRVRWKGVLTRYATVGRVRGRIGALGEGGRYEDLDFAGLTMYAAYKGVTLGGRAGYDFPSEDVSFSVNLRMDAPWLSLSGHSSVDPINPYHLQSVYGSIELDSRPRLTRQPRTFSSAVLRGFADENRDGAWNPTEPQLPELQIDVVKAVMSRLDTGGLRADFLAPSAQYQVIIDPKSLPGPGWIVPVGTTFSFVSDPGDLKEVNIPVVRNTIIEGRLAETPLSSPTLAQVIFMRDEVEVVRSPVSQEGLFSTLLAPGTYEVVVRNLGTGQNLPAFSQSVTINPIERQILYIQSSENR